MVNTEVLTSGTTFSLEDHILTIMTPSGYNIGDLVKQIMALEQSDINKLARLFKASATISNPTPENLQIYYTSQYVQDEILENVINEDLLIYKFERKPIKGTVVGRIYFFDGKEEVEKSFVISASDEVVYSADILPELNLEVQEDRLILKGVEKKATFYAIKCNYEYECKY